MTKEDFKAVSPPRPSPPEQSGFSGALASFYFNLKINSGFAAAYAYAFSYYIAVIANITKYVS